MKITINKKITAQSVLAGIAFAASAAGLNFATWTPHSLEDWVRVGVVFVIGFAVALLGLNTQDPASATFVKDAVSLLETILVHPDTRPEVKADISAFILAKAGAKK